jgi:archaellum biogenesis ATPase FlaH
MSASYDLSAFGHLTSPKQLISTTILESDIPSVDDVKALANWDSMQKKVFDRSLDDFREQGKDRSRSLANLAFHGAELGWTDEQIYSVISDADERWGKYAERWNREQILVELINKARQKHGYEPAKEFDIDKILKITDVTLETEERPGDDLGIMNIDELNALELDVEWLMEGLIHSRGFGLLTGRQGTGKTQLALQLAACLATGQDNFLNWSLPAHGAKKVLFLSLEMGSLLLKQFTTPLRKNYPQAELAKNLPILPLGQAVPMDLKEGQEYFDAILERHQPDFVIIDSLEAVASTELTDEGAVKQLMNYLAGVRDRYACALMIIHHHRKRSNDFASQKRPNSLYDVYGANLITTKIDFVLDADKWRDAKGEQPDKSRLTLNTLKNRLAAELDHPVDIVRDHTLHFRLHDEDAINRMAGDLIDDFDTSFKF